MNWSGLHISVLYQQTEYKHLPCRTDIKINRIVFHHLQKGSQVILGRLCILENVAALLGIDSRNSVSLKLSVCYSYL